MTLDALGQADRVIDAICTSLPCGVAYRMPAAGPVACLSEDFRAVSARPKISITQRCQVCQCRPRLTLSVYLRL